MDLAYGSEQRTFATVLAVVTVIEGVGWHVLFRHHPFVAYPADLLSLSTFLLMLRSRRELAAHPHQLGESVLTLRAGSKRSLDVPLVSVGQVSYSAVEAVKPADDQLAFLAKGVRPNARLALSTPLTVHGVSWDAVSFALDERSSATAIQQQMRVG